MKMNKKLSAALALSMVVGATTTVPVMAETTNNLEKTTNDTTKSATDLRNEANAAKAKYEEAAAAKVAADQELATAQKKQIMPKKNTMLLEMLETYLLTGKIRNLIFIKLLKQQKLQRKM